MNSKGLNIFVCGRFHYHKYVSMLRPNTELHKVFFSHKIGQTLGLQKENYSNLFLKEYFLYSHLRALGGFGLQKMMPFYHWIWSKQVRLSLDVAQANLFLAHGNCLQIMKECKKRGGVLIAEVVNAHPDELNELLGKEHKSLGIPYVRKNSIDSRIVEEANLADIVLAPSKSVANSYIKRGIIADKVRILNYGVFPSEGKVLDLGLRVHKQRVGELFKIICVAKITPRKGQIHLVRAVKLLKEKLGDDFPLELTLLGRSDKSYFDMLLKLGVPFRHIEHIDNSQMCNLISQYDLLVLPSIEDGFGVVVGEALSVGVPVITTNTSGAADIVEQINSHLVVPPGECQALAIAIKNVMNNSVVFNSVFVQGWSDYASRLCKEVISLRA